jgi:hypothetical protein
MAVDEMLARGRQIRGARHEVDVDPRVHAEPRGVRRGDDVAEGIERLGLPRQIRRARLDAAAEVRVAAPAHLHEERVEPVLARGPHERRDAVGRGERGAQHPEGAHFCVRRRRGIGHAFGGEESAGPNQRVQG